MVAAEEAAAAAAAAAVAVAGAKIALILVNRPALARLSGINA